MLFALPALAASAPLAGPGQAKIGPVNLDWKTGGNVVGNTLQLKGAVHLASATYDLKAETVTVSLLQGKRVPGSLGISQAIAVGDPASGTQVAGRFRSEEEGRTYDLHSDRAVYVPEAGRAGGGRIDFTGHVTVALLAPQSLEGPANITNLEHAVVLLGVGPSYPQVSFGQGTLTFTPLQ